MYHITCVIETLQQHNHRTASRAIAWIKFERKSKKVLSLSSASRRKTNQSHDDIIVPEKHALSERISGLMNIINYESALSD